MFSLRAFHFQQKDFDLYVTTMTTRQLSTVCTVDRWNPGRDIAYQRPELRRRFAEIARYLTREEGVLPTSVLLSARPDARITIEPLDGHESPEVLGQSSCGYHGIGRNSGHSFHLTWLYIVSIIPVFIFEAELKIERCRPDVNSQPAACFHTGGTGSPFFRP